MFVFCLSLVSVHILPLEPQGPFRHSDSLSATFFSPLGVWPDHLHFLQTFQMGLCSLKCGAQWPGPQPGKYHLY